MVRSRNNAVPQQQEGKASSGVIGENIYVIIHPHQNHGEDEKEVVSRRLDSMTQTSGSLFAAKKELEGVSGIPVGQQHLINNGVELIPVGNDDNDGELDKTILSRIPRGSYLIGLLRSQKYWTDHVQVDDTEFVRGIVLLELFTQRVHIRTMAGQDLVVGVSSDMDTISDIKRRIQQVFRPFFYASNHLPPEHQRLFFNGRLLHDSTTVKDAELVNGSVLYLIKMEHPDRMNNDQSSVSLLRNNSSTFTPIPRVAHRGITLFQLKQVVRQIIERCSTEHWTSTNPSSKGHVLKPEEVTLYDLAHYYIMPLTKEQSCSYVEYINSGTETDIVAGNNETKDAAGETTIGISTTTPEWFVSHWWGEPVLHFVYCLERHAYDRNIDSLNTPYWICAYANNQHDIASELGSTPKQSPFYEALQLARGTVSIVDQKSICFSRCWCAYEIWLSIHELAEQRRLVAMDDESKATTSTAPSSFLYDVYTIANHDGGLAPVGITDGYVQSDKYRDTKKGSLDLTYALPDSSYSRVRMERQSNFSQTACTRALDLKLEDSNASTIEDKWRILNSIAGSADLDAEPPEEHQAYEEVNVLLRAKFAASGYRFALEDGDVALLERYRERLRVAPLIHLQLSFVECPPIIRDIPNLIQCLPITLQALDLDLSYVNFDSTTPYMSSLGRLENLRSFHLTCHKHSVTNMGILWDELSQLSNMEELHIHSSWSRTLNSIGAIGQSISNMPKLKRLKLDFSFCDIHNLHGIMDDIKVDMKQMSTMELKVSHSRKLSGIDDLSNLLSSMPNLKSLTVDIGSCSEVLSIAKLSQTIQSFTKLQVLKFTCHNTPLSDDELLGFCQSAISLPDLSNISLQFPSRRRGEDCLGFRLRGTFASPISNQQLANAIA